MLKKCNDAWLQEMHVPEKYLFFYQVWGEVTEPRTLSTYQYRLMNTLSILSELLDILSMAQQNIYAVGNELEACLGEARSIIAQDFVLKERCPKPLKVLQSALSQNPKGRNDYLKLTAQLEAFLRGMEHQYLEILLEYLKDQLAGGTDRDSKKKTHDMVDKTNRQRVPFSGERNFRVEESASCAAKRKGFSGR